MYMYPMQVELIDKEIRSEENEAEQIADVFLCCVCLDLLYKPVVLACGHASCFWCVQKSMSGHRESHCPLCRNPYHHFPTICHMLHALLLKMYPATYKMRANQILEEEKKMHFFSPTLNDFCASHSCDINAQGWSSISSSQDNFPPDIYKIDAYVQRNNCRPSSTASGFQTICNDISHPTLIDDLLCVTCKQLLFRPVVINCGHVYCESCLAPVDGPIVCEICQSPHPRGFPKVCLSLDHFIEERFADEYVARKSLVQLKQVQFQHESQPNAKAGESGVQFPDESLLRCCADNGSKVHVRVGCDCCGVNFLSHLHPLSYFVFISLHIFMQIFSILVHNSYLTRTMLCISEQGFSRSHFSKTLERYK